jgi:WD40 repeat protein
VLSASADKTARLWRLNGEVAQTLNQDGQVTDASFVGANVLTAGDDGTAKLWRVADGALLATYPHGATVRAAVAAGGTVVTAGDDGVVRSWTQAGRLRWAAKHGSPIAAAAVSRDGTVATGAADGTVRLWAGRNGAALHMLKAHTGAITSLAFDSTGKLLVSGSADHTARIWNVSAGNADAHARSPRRDGHVGVIQPRPVPRPDLERRRRRTPLSVATGRTVHRLSFHVATVSQAAFSPDGRSVVTAGPSTAGVWQVRTGRLLYFVRGARGTLSAAAWAPDSLRIVAGDLGGGV